MRPKLFVSRSYTFLLLLLLISIAGSFMTGSSNIVPATEVYSTTPIYADIINHLNMSRVEEHILFLSDLETRALGYPENLLAARYIHDRFIEYGLVNVSYHSFTAPAAVDHGANLTILETGETIRVYPIEPNLVCPSTTPPEGLSGPLVYAGDGSFEAIGGKPLNGSIVLMDWSSENRWLTVASLGAKAVIFTPPIQVRPEQNYPFSDKTVDAPLNFPRFYIPDPQASALVGLAKGAKPVQVHLLADTRWVRATGWNVMGFVEGTTYPDRTILVSSYFDSGSVAPSYAPGAQEACGIAALLEFAKNLASDPPKYSVMFIAFDGHHNNLAGAFAFLEDGFWPQRNQTIKAIAEHIIMGVNLDFSTGSNALYVADFGNYIGMPGGDSANVWGGGAWPPIGAIIEYWKEIWQDVNQEAPGGKTYNAEFFKKMWAGENLEHMEIQSWTTRAYDIEPMHLFRVPSYTFATIYDVRPYFKTPFDTFYSVNLDNLQDQVELFYCFINRITNLDILYDHYITNCLVANNLVRIGTFVPKERPSTHSPPAPLWYQLKGTIAEWNETEAWYTPVPDALVYINVVGGWGYFGRVGVDTRFTFADHEGRFEFYGVHYTMILQTSAWVVEPSTGNVLYAPDLGMHEYAPPQRGDIGPETEIGYLVVFKAATMALFNTYSPSTLRAPEIYTPTETRFIPREYSIRDHKSLSPVTSFGHWSYQTVDDVVTIVGFPPGVAVDLLMQVTGMRYPLICLLNSTDENPAGSGYRLQAGGQLLLDHPQLRYAETFQRLNAERLKTLSSIDPKEPQYPSYQKHLEAGALIDRAREAAAQGDYQTYFETSSLAWSMSREAYLYVRPKIEDAALVVPFFALLLVPFVYLAERLLFNLKGVKKVYSYALLFTACLGALYLLHPGFSLAASPIMVVIGFSNAILLSPVLAIMITRVKDLIKAVRLRLLGRHEVELARASAAIYGFSVGLENMRKRKLRTVLTLLSVIMVVAAIVNLTAISAVSASKILPQVYAGTPPYEGVYIHKTSWGYGAYGIGLHVVEYLKATYAENATVIPRAWKYTDYPSTQNPLLRIGFKAINPINGKMVRAPVLWGLTPEETSLSHPDIFFLEGTNSRWFTPGESNVMIITQRQANTLGITDLPVKVTLGGLPYTVIGIITSQYGFISDLDGEFITPIKFDVPTEQNLWDLHVELDTYCFILPFEDVISVGGDVASITVTLKNASYIQSTASEIMKKFPEYLTYSCVEENVILNTAGLALSVWGAEFQVVLLSVAALGLFNAMLGSVYERKGEIRTYSSVGLNPMHITFVFLAEALTYALVGSVLGFILAMFLCKFSATFLPGVVILNYSSSWVATAVAAGILVTVASSLYPMYSASKLLTPSLERAWKIRTKPKGDRWEIPVPFVVASEDEAGGVMAYLHEFAEAHAGERAPDFSATNIQLDDGETRDGLHYKKLSLDAFLSPYEIGVHQNTQVQFTLSENRWLLGVLLNRKSGSVTEWERMNRDFVDLLRKQMLLWRSLEPKERESYFKRYGEMKKGKGAIEV